MLAWSSQKLGKSATKTSKWSSPPPWHRNLPKCAAAVVAKLPGKHETTDVDRNLDLLVTATASIQSTATGSNPTQATTSVEETQCMVLQRGIELIRSLGDPAPELKVLPVLAHRRQTCVVTSL